MDQGRFEDLKEAYALDTLPEEERLEFERYLSDNPSAQAEVEGLSSVASLLALAPPEQKQPARLRRSLMSQVRSEARESGSAYTAGSCHGSREGWAKRLFGPRGLGAVAVAAALIGLLVWNVSLQSEAQNLRDFQMSAYELQGSGEAEAVQGEVVKVDDQGAMLITTDLPDLPEDKTYEMWSIDEDQQAESCGIFKAGDSPAIQTMEQPISEEVDTFAITVEPEGGSEQPTTEPIIEADLTNRT